MMLNGSLLGMSEERKNIIGNTSSNYTVINSDFHSFKPIFENRLHAKSANSSTLKWTSQVYEVLLTIWTSIWMLELADLA